MITEGCATPDKLPKAIDNKGHDTVQATRPQDSYCTKQSSDSGLKRRGVPEGAVTVTPSNRHLGHWLLGPKMA